MGSERSVLLRVRDRRFAASSPSVTVLCPLAKHINPSLVLVQPRKTRPYISRKIVDEKLRSKSNKQTKTSFSAKINEIMIAVETQFIGILS